MQDFRTRLVCPECGEADNSELTRPDLQDRMPLLHQSVVRKCLDCEHVWWVDWSCRPAVGIR